MHTYNRLFFVFIVLATISAAAAGTSFDNENSFVHSIPNPVPEKTKIAKGDLNADGIDDLAVILITQEKNLIGGYNTYQQLFVLTQDDNKKFIPTESSQKVSCGSENCSIEYLYINKGSLYLKIVGGGSCNSITATHQFKFYKQEWRLIGRKNTEYYLKCSSSGNRFQEHDINFLTGYSIQQSKIEDEPLNTWKWKSKRRKFLLKEYGFFIAFGDAL